MKRAAGQQAPADLQLRNSTMKEYPYYSRQLGTDVTISIVTEREDDANYLAGTALQIITGYERQFSRFLPTSELSQLNAKRDMVVSGRFISVLQSALALHALTAGVYNPLVQVRRFGYDQSFEEIHPKASRTIPTDETYNTDVTALSHDRESGHVSLAEGQLLDFGGFLKGYMAQQIVNHLIGLEVPLQGMIVNLGGDLCTIGTDANGEPFVFRVYNPITKSETPLIVRDSCLATSGTYKRVWEFNGDTVHHLLDRTGIKNINTNIISASVVHETGSLAEGYAKVLLSTPESEARSIINNPKLTYLLITKDGEIIRS